MRKKIISFILTAILISTASVSVFAKTYTREDYPTKWTFANGKTLETFFDEKGFFAAKHENGTIVWLVNSNAIHLPNSYNGGVIDETAKRNTKTVVMETSTEESPQTNVPTPLTDEQLKEVISEAPSHTDTVSSITLSERRITETELDAWIAEYNELGGMNAFELEIGLSISKERQMNFHHLQYVKMQ